MSFDPALFTPFFHETADVAGTIALTYFRKNLAIDDKQDRSPVTQADKEIEHELRRRIKNKFPDHGIIGEEFGTENPDATFVWVLDPIDGTRAFMMGKPLFGSIIGLLHHGTPVMGLIDQPYTKERWIGVTGRRAEHNGDLIHVAAPRSLKAARLITGSPEMFEQDAATYDALRHAARWQQYGCDCYAYGLLAMGCADVVVEQCLKIWDAVGIVPIVTGAGGFVSDWNNRPIDRSFDGRLICASSESLARETTTLLLKSRQP